MGNNQRIQTIPNTYPETPNDNSSRGRTDLRDQEPNPYPPNPPVDNDALYRTYEQYGLTYKSNHSAVTNRDLKGNIILNENDIDNQLLIFEAVVEQFTNRSVIKAIDTQFQYFKFPALTTVTGDDFEDFEINIDTGSFEQDYTFARYTPARDWTIPQQSSPFSGLLFDKVQVGIAQTNPNAYSITPEMKNSGVDLRIKAKLSHKFNGPNAVGTAYFSIMKLGPSGENRSFREFREKNSVGNDGVTGNNVTTDGEKWQKDVNGNNITSGRMDIWDIKTVYAEWVIPNSEFQAGDMFHVGGMSGGGSHSMLKNVSYIIFSNAEKTYDEWGELQ